MTEFLTPTDLSPFASIADEKAEQMIADATALAVLAAPCLADTDEDNPLTAAQVAAAKAVLRAAVLRWNDAGAGARTQETVGPFSQSLDTSQPRRGMFWPSEITQLQDVCAGADSTGAYSVDTAPSLCGVHAEICGINFGATYCSCGVDIAGFPLYEGA